MSLRILVTFVGMKMAAWIVTVCVPLVSLKFTVRLILVCTGKLHLLAFCLLE